MCAAWEGERRPLSYFPSLFGEREREKDRGRERLIDSSLLYLLCSLPASIF